MHIYTSKLIYIFFTLIGVCVEGYGIVWSHAKMPHLTFLDTQGDRTWPHSESHALMSYDTNDWFRVKLRASRNARPHAHRPDFIQRFYGRSCSDVLVCGSVERSGSLTSRANKAKIDPSLWKRFHHGA
jgi:hypothetical protein